MSYFCKQGRTKRSGACPFLKKSVRSKKKKKGTERSRDSVYHQDTQEHKTNRIFGIAWKERYRYIYISRQQQRWQYKEQQQSLKRDLITRHTYNTERYLELLKELRCGQKKKGTRVLRKQRDKQ